MEAQLAALRVAFDYVEGVDGLALRLPDAEIVDPALSTQPWFRPGVVGCALSHRRACEQVIAGDLDRALILEDDVILPEDIASLADRVGQVMTGPEVVLLSFHSERPCKLVRQGAISLPRGRQLLYPVSAQQLTSAGAYIVTRDACLRMVQLNRPISIRADDWGRWKKAGAVERVRCVAPLTVRKDFRFLSVIGHHPPRTLHGRLQRMARSPVPVLSQALALRRTVIESRWSRVELVDEAPDRPAPG